MTNSVRPEGWDSPSRDLRSPFTEQSPSYDEEIDATLSLLAQTQPAAGFEQRIQARLASADSTPARRPWLLHAISSRNHRLAASVMAATAVIAGILAYSSQHGSSQHGQVVSPRVTTIPMMHVAPHQGGAGTAGAIRISPQPARPVLRPHARSNVHSGHARAWIDGHHKPLPAGVALPKSPHAEASYEDSLPNPEP